MKKKKWNLRKAASFGTKVEDLEEVFNELEADGYEPKFVFPFAETEMVHDQGGPAGDFVNANRFMVVAGFLRKKK